MIKNLVTITIEDTDDGGLRFESRFEEGRHSTPATLFGIALETLAMRLGQAAHQNSKIYFKSPAGEIEFSDGDCPHFASPELVKEMAKENVGFSFTMPAYSKAYSTKDHVIGGPF